MSSQKLFVFPTGDPQIDAQHDELLGCTEKLRAAENVMTAALCAMRFYQQIREHFACEAKLMRKLEYPAMKAHVDHHELLTSKLNKVVTNFAIEPRNKADLESFIAELTQHHVGTYDTQLAVFMTRKGEPHAQKARRQLTERDRAADPSVRS